jgi:hypothetical protein
MFNAKQLLKEELCLPPILQGTYLIAERKEEISIS